jgi:hypothetical protein
LSLNHLHMFISMKCFSIDFRFKAIHREGTCDSSPSSWKTVEVAMLTAIQLPCSIGLLGNR